MVSTQDGTQAASSSPPKANGAPKHPRAPRRRGHGEGTVYYDETRDRWVGQAWVDGRRRKVTAKTKLDASARLGRLIHGDIAERDTDRRITVAKLLDEWQTKALANRTRAASTVERHAWACARLTVELGRIKVAALDAAQVERALAAMAAEGLSRASLTEVRGTLRQALRWAVRRRYVAWNAADAAELPTGTKARRDKHALAVAELDALLTQLEQHPWRAMFALSARVGLRPGEAAGICADALDLGSDPPTVAVVRAVHLEKGRPVLSDDLKTKGSRRTIALPADVAELLETADKVDGLVFTGEDGGPIWPSTARSELTAACAAAGIPKVTPNELRHTAATHMADRGVPPHVIADILGHSTTRMVDETYRHRPAVIRGAEL